MEDVTPDELAQAEEYGSRIEQYIKVAKTVCDNRRLGFQPPPHLMANVFVDIVMAGEKIPNNLIKS